MAGHSNLTPPLSIRLPPCPEKWEYVIRPVSRSNSALDPPFEPIRLSPCSEDWDYEISLARATSSLNPPYVPISLPPCAENWDDEYDLKEANSSDTQDSVNLEQPLRRSTNFIVTFDGSGRIQSVKAPHPDRNRSETICWRCQGVGHYKRECPSLTPTSSARSGVTRASSINPKLGP